MRLLLLLACCCCGGGAAGSLKAPAVASAENGAATSSETTAVRQGGHGSNVQRLPDIHWNTSNPMFRIDNTDHIIDVNRGHGRTNHQYDQVNIICPIYGSSTPAELIEKYIIYAVNKEEYDSCRIMSPHPRILAQCDSPHQFRVFTISFRSFSPTPGALEFKAGKDYYFISTSSRQDLHQRVDGMCRDNNMKVVFKVADNSKSKETSKSSSSSDSDESSGVVFTPSHHVTEGKKRQSVVEKAAAAEEEKPKNIDYFLHQAKEERERQRLLIQQQQQQQQQQETPIQLNDISDYSKDVSPVKEEKKKKKNGDHVKQEASTSAAASLFNGIVLTAAAVAVAAKRRL